MRNGVILVRAPRFLTLLAVVSLALCAVAGVRAFSTMNVDASTVLSIVPSPEALVGVEQVGVSGLDVERGQSASLSLQIWNRSAASLTIVVDSRSLVPGVDLAIAPSVPGVIVAAGGSTISTITVSAHTAAALGPTRIHAHVRARRFLFSAQVDFEVPVTVRNAPPVAQDDEVTTQVDSDLTFDPADNDSDPEGSGLTIDSVTQGLNGEVTLGRDGHITYAPTQGWSGTDSFTYSVRDADGSVSSATVTITVNK